MPIKHYIIKGTKMKWKGVFDFDKLYKVIKRWMDFEGYGDEMDGFNEKKYKERIQAGGAKMYEIVWEGKKEVSSYFTFVMEITFLLLGVKEIEVEMDGKRVKMNKGEVEMRFNTYVIKGKPGQCSLFGGAARLAEIGDKLLVISYALMNTEEAKMHSPKIVMVDEKNNLKLKIKD